MAELLKRQDLIDDQGEREYKTVTLPPRNPAKSTESVQVRLRSMFGGELIDLENSCTNERGEPIAWRQNHYRELQAAFCVVDEQGKRIFSDEDIKTTWWKRQHPRFIRALLREVRKINGDEIGEGVEDEVKNLPEIGEGEPPQE